MKIQYSNVNFINDIILPNEINEINKYILQVCKTLPALNITSDAKLLNETIDIVNNFANEKKLFIVFGTGGSSLGARALINISNNVNNNIIFFDNIDPVFFEKSFKNLDFNSTGFIVISKSGTTLETLSQFGSIVELASQKNELSILYSNTLVITEIKDSPLFNIANKNQCLLLEHKENIGGRYSVFSNVGMVPAIIAGINVKIIHKAVQDILNKLQDVDLFKIGQIFRYQNNFNYTSNVIMTYSDQLYYFGQWYLQLWAESIGKNNKGITAIHSVGTTDQHSQLQLYLDGPKDKFFTFVTTQHNNQGLSINNDIMQLVNADYLIDKKMGDLMQAEQKATIDTFNLHQFRFREILLPNIDEIALGSTMTFSIIETIAACIYFEVNPFDQPAVEQGKILTKKYLT